MTIQDINAKIDEQLLTFREDEPRQHNMRPFRPCPVCPGVLREESGEFLICWTCGSVMGLPVDQYVLRR